MAKFALISTDEIDRGNYERFNDVLEDIKGEVRVMPLEDAPFLLIYSIAFKNVDMISLVAYVREDDFPDEEISRYCYVMEPLVAVTYLKKKRKK